MRIISFEEADPKLKWDNVTKAIYDGHQLPKAEIGDLLLQSAPNALLSRGAWIPGLGMALKSMSVFPDNASLTPPEPSIKGGVLLFDGQNGDLKAVLDGILVTKWKTAGDSVLGARLLAKPEPKTHLMVGAGTVAATILSAYHEIFPSIERFMVWNRNTKRAEELLKSMTDQVPGIEIVEDLETACRQADVVTSATMAVEPILKGEWIEPGTHVDLIGAFKPNMREADDVLLKKAKIFVDSYETTVGHIGEIEIPLQAGTISHEDILGDLYNLCGADKFKRNSDDITVFKNGGGAHLDLMTSIEIFNSM